jgi:hypothetical protein
MPFLRVEDTVLVVRTGQEFWAAMAHRQRESLCSVEGTEQGCWVAMARRQHPRAQERSDSVPAVEHPGVDCSG